MGVATGTVTASFLAPLLRAAPPCAALPRETVLRGRLGVVVPSLAFGAPARARARAGGGGGGEARGLLGLATHLLASVSAAGAGAPMALKAAGLGAMRLHLYDHCPYCTRVELLLGWRGLPYDRKVYGYADVEGPKRLTGKKSLPVLEWSDEHGETHILPESKDIVEFLDTSGDEGRLIAPKTGRKDIEAWHRRLRRVMHSLTRPRLLRMPIADFATEADRRYQMEKYIAGGFDYDIALANTEALMPKVEAILEDFEPLVGGDYSLNRGGWSWDDLHILPALRVLTCVGGLTWPPCARRYVEGAHASAGVPLYFDHAC